MCVQYLRHCREFGQSWKRNILKDRHYREMETWFHHVQNYGCLETSSMSSQWPLFWAHLESQSEEDAMFISVLPNSTCSSTSSIIMCRWCCITSWQASGMCKLKIIIRQHFCQLGIKPKAEKNASTNHIELFLPLTWSSDVTWVYRLSTASPSL